MSEKVKLFLATKKQNQQRTAKASEYKKSYKFEQIFKTIRNMPTTDLIEKRNKAIIPLQEMLQLYLMVLYQLQKGIVRSISCH